MPGENEHVIRHEVVRISPDLTGFEQKLRIGVNKAVKGPPPVTAKVRVVADLTGFRTDLRNKLKTVDVRHKVKIEADAKGLHQSIRNALRQAKLSIKDETFEIQLDVSTDKAERSATSGLARLRQRFRTEQEFMDHMRGQAYQRDVQRVIGRDQAIARAEEAAYGEQRRRDAVQERERTRISEQGERERAARRKKFTDLAGRDRFGPKIVDFGGSGIRPMNALLGIVAAMSPALFAMGASAVQASTAIAGLGAAGIGAAAGIVALTVGFSRVREALKLRDAAIKADMRSTTQKAAQVRAIQSANRQVADSERNLADALIDAARARRGINEVYQEATRDLRDLREAVADLALEESEASLGVDQAREKQAEVNRNFWATELEKREAAIDVQKALERQSDLTTEAADRRQDLANAERKGVENSDKVVAAREREADANRRVADAQRALNEARADRSTTVAAKTLPNAGNAAAEELAARRKEMSKSANEMLDFFIKNEGMFKKLRGEVEDATLPGFTKFLTDVTARGKDGTSTLDVLTESVTQAGGAISKTVGDLGETVKTPWFKGQVSNINAENAKAFDLLGQAANTLVKPLTRIVVAASPLFTRFSKGMLEFAEWLDRVVENADNTGKLAKWFEKAGDSFGRWVELGKQVGRLILPFFTQSLPAGDSLVDRLTKFVSSLADWSNSPEGRKQITDFFETVKNLKYGEIGKFLADLTLTIGAFKLVRLGIKHPFVALFGALATIDPATTGALLDTLAKTVLSVLGFVNDHKEAAATVLGIFGAAKGIGQILDIGIKLPGIDNLRSWLTGKFSWLDTLLGGSKTATMNVTAGVVNVYGGIGAPGGPDVDLPGRTGKVGTVFKIIGAVAITAAAVDLISTSLTDKHVWELEDLPPTLKDRLDATRPVPGKVMNEAKAWQPVEGLLADARQGRVPFMKDDIGAADRANALQNWVASRKEHVRLLGQEIEKTRGAGAAQKFLADQQDQSRRTLIETLQAFGWTPSTAEGYATKIFGGPSDTQQAIDNIANVNRQLGIGKAEAEAYARALLGVPDVRTTTVDTRFSIMGTPLTEKDFAQTFASGNMGFKAADSAYTVTGSGNQGFKSFEQAIVGGAGNQNLKSFDATGTARGNAGGPIPGPGGLSYGIGQNLMLGIQAGFDDQARKFNTQYLPVWGPTMADHMKSVLGEDSPSKITYVHGEDLINGLWNGFTERWTGLLDTVTTWIDDNILTPFRDQFAGGSEGIKRAFTNPFATLTDNLAPHIKKALSWLDTNLLTPVNNVLRAVGAEPIVGALASVAASGAKQLAAVVSRADGGPVPGFSPHSRADNIPAMLTAKEFVQPVDAVKHYGTDFMEAVRTKQLPMYADGGLVEAYGAANGTEGFVNKLVAGAIRRMGGNTVQDIANNAMSTMFGGFLGGGKAVGDIGVARIAEATARSMGATAKQLVALMEAGIVESGMRNISFGDRDSVGFLQQRAGWGSMAQRMDVAHATASFIRAAKAKDNPKYTAGQLAQAVQVSAFPLRYDQREADAVAILNREAPGIAMGGGGGPLGGQAGGRGWRWQESVLRAAFGNRVQFFSTTGGGHAASSWHYKGRALDLTPSMEMFNWIRSNYGANTLELIYSPAVTGIKNGKAVNIRGFYGNDIYKQHFNHVHWAFGEGGEVPNFDQGGVLNPGLNIVNNTTGGREELRPPGTGRLDRRDIALLAQAIAAAISSQQVHMDGRAVGEIIHAYDYLPRGL